MNDPNYQNIKDKCLETYNQKKSMKWELKNDHTSRVGEKWLKEEDDFIKECYEKQYKVKKC